MESARDLDNPGLEQQHGETLRFLSLAGNRSMARARPHVAVRAELTVLKARLV